MEKILEKIEELIEKECKSGFAPEWFFEAHILAVKKYADFLLEKLPEANKDVVLLGVWLHDLQRIRGIEGDHQKIGAEEAEKVMQSLEIDKNISDQVKQIILTHSCSNELPITLEGKILASADAMSHYINDFYLQIMLTRDRNLRQYKEWALEKLDRDFEKKIFFDFAKEEIKERHDALKKIFTMS
jgi:HD superfamily phosphodiesterase